MPFDGITTFSVVQELRDKLIHGKINKIYQPESDEILLNINNRGNKYSLLISANNNNPRIHLTAHTKGNPLAPPMFCMLLRKNIQNSTILEINQLGLDRIVEIRLRTKNELGDTVTKRLVVEIMGRHSNVTLINEPEEVIVDSIKRVGKNISTFREVLPGRVYKAPPQDKNEPINVKREPFLSLLHGYAQNKTLYKFIIDTFIGVSPPLSHEICHRAKINSDRPLSELTDENEDSLYNVFNNLYSHLEDHLQPFMYTNKNKSKVYDFSAIDYTYYELYHKTDYASISGLLEEYYYLRDSLSRIQNRSSSMVQMLNNKLERDYHKLDKQIKEFQDAEDAEIYRKYGELITSQIYLLEGGQKSAVLSDYYTGEEIEIPLSVQLSPSENAQKYFKKYNKGKRAKEYLKEQMSITKEEIYYLESQIDNIRKCTEIEEFNEIKEDLIENGYLKAQGRKKSNKKEITVSQPMKYIYEGVEIYVGKNNKQNEYLTTKFAAKTDLWLHVKDMPGSHVIVKKDADKVDDKLLYTAALLAAYYSKGKESSNIPIDYTAVKYVKKPKGAKTGMVIYTDQKTLYVTPKEDEVLKIDRVD
ncbi:NFACT family protein [Alkalibaculum bacchi]|uniref:Rqc2 family fibronectin-binding protein n=1 Tax=Alkalibaculum bacchi TaxID=645887 RepID=UPI0026F0E36D|nr:NFACT RNA binding domain-containing protein [Alkalibaculum bacchi]